MEARCFSCHADLASHGHYTVGLDRIDFDDENVLKKGLEQNYGICGIRFDYFNGDLLIDHNPKHIKPEEIEKALHSPGYVLDSNARRWLGNVIEKHDAVIRAAVSGALVAISWALHIALGDAYRFPSIPFILINASAIIASGYPTLRGLMDAFRERKINVHIIIAFAALGAIALLNWLEAATILFVTVMSEAIEGVVGEREESRRVEAGKEQGPTIARGDGEEGSLPSPSCSKTCKGVTRRWIAKHNNG